LVEILRDSLPLIVPKTVEAPECCSSAQSCTIDPARLIREFVLSLSKHSPHSAGSGQASTGSGRTVLRFNSCRINKGSCLRNLIVTAAC
jgi:hypothetical protein